MFLEAEARRCEIKINCQGMFAIPIPVPARRVEDAGGEGHEGQLSSARRQLLPEGFPGFTRQGHSSGSFQKVPSYMVVTTLHREREETL